MKKIFSFFAALLTAGTMMAQAFDHGLYVPANASIQEVATEVGTTATYDSATDVLTINIAGPHTSWGDWGNQIKFLTGITAMDPTKNYEIGFTAVASTDDCPVSHMKAFDGDGHFLFDITGESYTTTAREFKQVVTGIADCGGLFVWSFAYTPAQTVTISDFYVRESTAPVVEDPKPTTAPAAPTAEASTVLSVYSNAYSAAAPFGFLEAWGQTTTLQELDLEGNNVLYYKNFNWLGWATANPIDASTCTGLHLDIWAAAAGSIRVVPIYGGAGLATDDTHGKVVTLAEGWNSVDLNLATDFPGLNFESIFQMKFDQNVGGNIFAFDNVYFTGYTAPAVTYTSLADVYTKAKGDTVVLKDFEVVYAPATDTRYYYIKDATASGLIYKSNYGLQAGDKVAKGLVAKIDIYNNLYELVPVTAKADLTITAGTAPAPAVATAAPTAADNNFVVYKNVKFLADSIGTVATADRTVNGVFGNDTVVFYNTFKIPAVVFDANKTYDVVGFNTCYKTTIQVAVASIEEHQGVVDECAGEHGLFNAETAAINGTYLAPGWNEGAGADHTASIENGTIVLHVGAQGYVDMWNGQVFVNPGFTFTEGKMYHYEFDVESAGKVCMTVKVNDSDENLWFSKAVYDQNIGGGTFHFSTDSVIVRGALNANRGPLVFGFGWTDANQDVIIKCIKITEVGDAPQPVETHMYIKHPWGTGADADWTWQEMSESKYSVFDAYEYVGAWGGVGCNIADNAEGNNDAWYAVGDIQFLSDAGLVVEAPALTTECRFVYVPGLVGGASSPLKVIYTATALENVEVVNAEKVMINGVLYIKRDGKTYTVQGQEIR